MADTVNIVGVVVQLSVRVMLEVVVISGLRPLLRRWYVVRHIVVPDCAPRSTISGLSARLVATAKVDRRSLSAPGGGEGWGEVGDSRALVETHLTLPSLRDGPLPLPPEGRRGILFWIPGFCLADRRGDGGAHILGAGVAAEIGRFCAALGEHLGDRPLDRLGGRGFAEMIEHHSARPDLADRVGDAAPGDVGR